MKKLFVLFTLISLMSFSKLDSFEKNTLRSESNMEIFKTKLTKHIDVTVNSTNGCSFHVVGDVSYSILPPRINGFQGSVTIGGGSGCPHGTYNINWTSIVYSVKNKNLTEDEVTLSFDTDVICQMSTAYWIASDESTTDALNNPELGFELIRAIKDGDCD